MIRRSLLKKLAFSIVPVIVLLAALEGMSRVLKHVNPTLWSPPTRYLNKNPAYTGQAWFTQDFLDATLTHGSSCYILPEYSFKLLKDHESKYHNVVHGRRLTTGGTWHAEDPRLVTIALFGGSSTYCHEVPDEYTWASLLQKRIAASPDTQIVRVLNFGVPGASSKQELDRLRYEISQGMVPDVCVFFDGVNDTAQGVYNGSPDKTINDTERLYKRKWYRQIARQSSLLTLVYANVRSWQMSKPTHLNDADLLEDLAMKTAKGLVENWAKAKQLCESHGIKMYAFLQPNLYTLDSNRFTKEEELLEDIRPGMDVCFQATYPLFRELMAGIQEYNKHFLDLSNIYEATFQPIYLDFCHVASHGNKIIADAIYMRIIDDVKAICKRKALEHTLKPSKGG